MGRLSLAVVRLVSGSYGALFLLLLDAKVNSLIEAFLYDILHACVYVYMYTTI